MSTIPVTELNLSPLACTVKPIYRHQVVVKEMQHLLQVPSKESRQLMLKRPKLPDGFQGRGLKGKVRERVTWCMISLCTIL